MKPNLKEGDDFLVVDEHIWKYLSEKYGVLNDIIREGIVVNPDTEECIVEFYLKPILLYPLPNK